MSTFEALPYVIVAVWSLPLVLLAALIVRCWRDVRREDRLCREDALHADYLAAGASPVQARALLTLVREEAS